jgi:hypothetical protein
MAAGDTMQGRRLPDTDQNPAFREGDYCKVRGVWHVRPPSSHMGSIAKHEVTEHEDGTITVSPSILLDVPGDPSAGWHGFLERGVWREV